MSITPSSPRQLFSRLGALVALVLVIGLLPSVAGPVASAQTSDDASAESDETVVPAAPVVPVTSDSSVADQASTSTSISTSTTATGGSSETSVAGSATQDSEATSTTSGSATTVTVDGEAPAVASDDQNGDATDEPAPEAKAGAEASDDDGSATTTTTNVDGTETTVVDDSAGATSGETNAETTDPAADGADVPIDEDAEEELDQTGDGETIITEKLEPLPGFTGGGAVISSNPIRRLGGGWYEQPVMVVGRNATAEIEAAIRDAERQGSADARALIEVQTRIAELSTANGLEADETAIVPSNASETGSSGAASSTADSSGTGSSTTDSSGTGSSGGVATIDGLNVGDSEVAVAGVEFVVSAAELARQAAWQDILDESRNRMLSGTASRAVALTDLETKRAAFDSATASVLESEVLIGEARDEAQRWAQAEREAQRQAGAAKERTIRSEALAATAGRTVTRYEALVEEARTDATEAVEEYETRRLDLRAVAVAWYVGSEVLAGNAGDLVEATTSGNRVEIGRVEALSLLDDRRALLKTATDELTSAQAQFSNRRFAVREAAAALASASEDVVAARAADIAATRSAAAAERSAAKALADFGDAEVALDVDRRRLAVATRERDALIARIDAAATDLVSARESYVSASLELGLDVSETDLAVLGSATDHHDHFAELHEVDAEHAGDEGGGEASEATDEERDTPKADLGADLVPAPGDGAGEGEGSEAPAAALSSTSSTEPVPSPEELAALAAADAEARAEEERLEAEQAEREAAVEDRRQQVEDEIAALKAQAQELTDRRGLAPSALRSLLNSSSVTFPIAGEWNFIDSWGFPRSGGRRHKGSDIFAPQGTPLVAIEDGRVSSKTNNLGGNVVYLYGDSGNTYYYAHLSAFHPRARAGGRIKAGEVLGFVGTSGNARGTPPHLHIGLKGPGTSAINPYPLMRALSEAVVAEQRRGARASVSPFVMPNLSAEVIDQLVGEGVPLLPSVVDALPPDVKADLQRRGIL